MRRFCRKVSWVVSIQARSWDIFLQRAAGGEPFMVIDFKGAHYPKAVIVHAVFFYVGYAVSYRDLEEILQSVVWPSITQP